MTAPLAGRPHDLIHLLTRAERLLGRRVTGKQALKQQALKRVEVRHDVA